MRTLQNPIAYFNYIQEIELPLEIADQCSHPGDCSEDVKECAQLPEIKAQLDEIDPERLKEELDQYGAWNETELSNHQDNLERILWIAAGDIMEETTEDN